MDNQTKTYCIAHGTLLNVMWQPGWDGSLGKNGYMCTYESLCCLPETITTVFISLSSVQFSRSVVSDSLRPHGLQHARLPCPSPTPTACLNSCPSSWWCQILDIDLIHNTKCFRTCAVSLFPQGRNNTWHWPLNAEWMNDCFNCEPYLQTPEHVTVKIFSMVRFKNFNVRMYFRIVSLATWCEEPTQWKRP